MSQAAPQIPGSDKRPCGSHLSDELPFFSVQASKLFAGRVVLQVQEVARALECTEQHIRDLIEEGRLGGIDITGKKIRKGRHCTAAKRYWRVPVSAFEHFIDLNKSL